MVYRSYNTEDTRPKDEAEQQISEVRFGSGSKLVGVDGEVSIS